MSTSVPPTIGLSLTLAKALDLARRGELQAAQRSLSATGEPPSDTTELHAFAALITATGDYPRALRCWRLLQTREPRHAEARRMIAAIELWQSRPAWYRFIPAGAAAAFILLAAAIVWSAVSSPAPAPVARPATSPVRASTSAVSPVSPVRPAVSEPLPPVQFKPSPRPSPGGTTAKRKPAR